VVFKQITVSCVVWINYVDSITIHHEKWQIVNVGGRAQKRAFWDRYCTANAECGDKNGSHPLTRNWITRNAFGIAMVRRGSRSAKFHTEIDGDAIRIMPPRRRNQSAMSERNSSACAIIRDTAVKYRHLEKLPSQLSVRESKKKKKLAVVSLF